MFASDLQPGGWTTWHLVVTSSQMAVLHFAGGLGGAVG